MKLREIWSRAIFAIRWLYCRWVVGHRWVLVRRVGFKVFRACSRCGSLQRGTSASAKLVLAAPDPQTRVPR